MSPPAPPILRTLVCRSSAVITFTAPKPAHMFAQLTRGTIVVAPIGTPEAAIVSAQNLYAVTPQEVAALFAPRALDSNKGRFGHVLVVGGSLGKSGAAAMCGMAALRIGAGLATVASPASVLPTVAGFAAELMTEPLGDGVSRSAAPGDAAHCLELAKSRDVLAIGPGLSQRPGVAEFVHRLVKGAHCPVVLDADGLNAFAGSPEPLQGGSRPLILTPHPGEMARLTGSSVAEIQANRVAAARDFARRHRCILVLKGFRTVIAYPGGEVWVVATGNPGMATGGTGDVLTGMIAGAVGQFPGHLEEAVRAAVFLHGLAGDAACEHTRRGIPGGNRPAALSASGLPQNAAARQAGKTFASADVFCAAIRCRDAMIRAMTRDFTSHSAEDTVELGRQLAAQLRNAHVVLLRGDLGAGKTTLVKGIAEGFGAAEADDVTSPTFTLIHEYHGPDKDVFHIDLYRLEKPGELDSLGLEDLMLEERNVLLIEWGEKFPRILQQKDAEIVIRRVGHDERKVRLTTGMRPELAGAPGSAPCIWGANLGEPNASAYSKSGID